MGPEREEAKGRAAVSWQLGHPLGKERKDVGSSGCRAAVAFPSFKALCSASMSCAQSNNTEDLEDIQSYPDTCLSTPRVYEDFNAWRHLLSWMSLFLYTCLLFHSEICVFMASHFVFLPCWFQSGFRRGCVLQCVSLNWFLKVIYDFNCLTHSKWHKTKGNCECNQLE